MQSTRGLFLQRCLICLVLVASTGAWAQDRPTRPVPVPSPSISAPADLEAPRLPSGTDTGVPGSGQKPAVTGNVKGDNTPRKMAQQRRGADPAASASRVDERAASRAAGRATPAASAASAAR